MKKCPCCDSKKIKVENTYLMNFWDAPNPLTSKIRNIWVENIEYTCSDCKKIFFNDLHLFNMKFRVTNRLIDYLIKNVHKKSFYDIMKETNISYERAFAIVNDLIKTKKVKY